MAEKRAPVHGMPLYKKDATASGPNVGVRPVGARPSAKNPMRQLFRGFMVLPAGLLFLYGVVYYKRQQAQKLLDEDPTERYLREMREGGWPVEELEERLQRQHALQRAA